MFETKDGELVRVAPPMRLAFRGGRTRIVDHERRAASRLKRQDLALAAALKSAHPVLNREGLSPAPAPAPGIEAACRLRASCNLSAAAEFLGRST
jgi:hypothetical protein